MNKILSMLQNAFWIMVFGLVIVYLFLSIMIFMMKISEKIVAFLIKKYKLTEKIDGNEIKTKIEKNDKAKIAAIGIAIKKYQEEKQEKL